MIKVFLFSLIFLLSCSHMRSGKYVKNEKGEWVFVASNVGIAQFFQDDGSYQGSWNGDFLWPVPSSRRISSKYGRRWGRNHDGIDIPAKRGTAIIAADNGKVMYSNNTISGYGNMIIVNHGQGMKTVYAHNSRNLVRKGQHVSRGEVIGYVGSTGRSTAPHVHFEVRRSGKATNPLAYFSRKVKRYLASKH